MKKRALLIVSIAIAAIVYGPQSATPSGPRELDYAEKLIEDGMLQPAQEELQRFLEGDVSPQSRQHATLLLGDIRSSLSQFAEAERLYFRAYEADPRGERACEALYRAGGCEVKLGRHREAGSTFSQVVARFPECPRFCAALRNVGLSFVERGDPVQAAKEFERGLALCADDEWKAELLYLLGSTLTRTDAVRARSTFELLRKAHRGSEAAFRGSVELARLLQAEGNTLGSLGVLDEALSFKVGKELLSEALVEKARLLDSMGRTADAAVAYSECARLSPDSLLSEECNLRAQSAFLAAGEYGQANLLAEKLLSRGATEAAQRASLFTRARAARFRNALRDALGFLEKIQCVGRADSLCLFVSIEEGMVREELEDREGAVAAYLRALTLPGPDELRATALMRLARLSGAEARTEETVGRGRAAAYYTLLADLYPESESVEPAVWELARSHETLGEYSEAAGAYRRLARDFPLSPRADEAAERASLLEMLFPAKVGKEDLQRLRVLLMSAAEGSVAGERLLEQAAILFESRLRSFDEAEVMLTKAMLSSPADRKHLLLWRLANVHNLLSRKLAFEGERKDAAKHKGLALRYLRDLLTQYGRTQLADDARMALIEEELSELNPPQKHRAAVSLYTDFLQGFPDTDRFEAALLRRAQALAELSGTAGDELYTEAMASYQKLIDEFPDSPLLAGARLGRGYLLRKAGNLDAAERELEIVVSRYSESPAAAEAAYELGECKLARRDLDRAISLYSFAFQNGRTRILRERALSRRGDCHLVSGELEKAVAEYEYILKHDPTGPFADDLLAREARAYLDRGMLKEASVPVERLAAQFPGSPLLRDVLIRKAGVETRVGESGKAAVTYAGLAKQFPEVRSDSTVMLSFGRASFESGDFSSSLEAYERALALTRGQASHREAARRIVLSLAKLGEDSKAQKRLGEFVKSFPSDTTLASELALERGLALYEAGDMAGAHARLAEALGGLRGEPRKKALVTMGLSKLRQNDFAAASAHFGQAVKLASSDSTLNFTAHFKLGTSLYAQSRYLEASRSYLDASRVASDATSRCDAWSNSALCLERAEKWSEAASLYEEIRTGCTGEQARAAAFKSGYCDLNAGRHRRAIEKLRQALETAEGEEKPEIQYWLGEAHAAMGEFERAASEFLKVPFLYGEGSLWAVTARFKAGMAFEQSGDVEAAAKQYTILLEREGENSQWGSMARERLQRLSR
ncbi:MAG: tetratricopeptide repeat protein [Candidatus Eiseniibacteriota bacterium]|nr:MAG: tetratricopeptide repeat protein [Candidatus Eisenbacteria bacterium]